MFSMHLFKLKWCIEKMKFYFLFVNFHFCLMQFHSKNLSYPRSGLLLKSVSNLFIRGAK